MKTTFIGLSYLVAKIPFYCYFRVMDVPNQRIQAYMLVLQKLVTGFMKIPESKFQSQLLILNIVKRILHSTCFLGLNDNNMPRVDWRLTALRPSIGKKMEL